MHIPRLVAAVVLVATLSTSHDARSDVTAAARAFAEGQAAQLEGNYEFAARRFELAYSLVPSKEALRSAARMRLLAEQPARAATLAERLLQSFSEDPSSVTLAKDILAETRAKLARFEVACTNDCAISVDGRALSLESARQHVFYLDPKRVSLSATFENGLSVERVLSGRTGETLSLEFVEPPTTAGAARPAAPVVPVEQPHAGEDARERPLTANTAAPPPASRRGLSPILPLLSGVATLATASVATWASLDVENQHDDYVRNPSEQRWDDGIGRQRLANVMWGTTAALGVTTAVLLLFTDFGGKEQSAVVVPAVQPEQASLAVCGKF